jgi:hypothetical protein
MNAAHTTGRPTISRAAIEVKIAKASKLVAEIAESQRRTLELRAELESIQQEISDDCWTRIPILNQDIIESILDVVDPRGSSTLIPRWEEDKHRFRILRYLASFCAISRMWLGPARRRLYRLIPFHTSGKSTALFTSKFLDTVLNFPTIRPYVQQLRIAYNIESSAALEAFWLEGIHLLPNCTVDLTIRSSRGSISEIFARGPSAACALTYFYTYCNPGWSPSTWEVAMQNWQRLESLSFDGSIISRNFGFESVTSDDPDQLLPRLQSLYLFGCQSPRFPLTSPNTLHSLQLHICWGVDPISLVRFVSRHSLSLRSITIVSTTFHPESDSILADVAASADSLTRISIARAHKSSSMALFRAIPQSVEVVELDGSYSLEECRMFAESRRGVGALREVLRLGENIMVGDGSSVPVSG